MAALSFIERSAATGTAIDGGEYDFGSFLTENDRLAFGNSLTSLLKSLEGKFVDVLPSSLLALLESQVISDGVERHSEPIKQIIETGSERALMWLRQILEGWEAATHTQKAVKANFKSRAEKRLESDDGPREALKSLLEVLSS